MQALVAFLDKMASEWVRCVGQRLKVGVVSPFYSLTYPRELVLSSLAVALDLPLPATEYTSAISRIEVGWGRDCFLRVVAAHRRLDVHRGAGFQALREGSLVRLRWGPIFNACSIPVDTLLYDDCLAGAKEELSRVPDGGWWRP